MEDRIDEEKLPQVTSKFSLKKNTSLQHVVIRDGVKIYRFTDKRGPMQRIETDRLLTNHQRALGHIRENIGGRNG